MKPDKKRLQSRKSELIYLAYEVVTGQRRVNIGSIDTRFKFSPPEGCGVVRRRFFIVTIKLITVAFIE